MPYEPLSAEQHTPAPANTAPTKRIDGIAISPETKQRLKRRKGDRTYDDIINWLLDREDTQGRTP